MNYEKLKSILFKSNVKVLIIGIVILVMGVLAALFPFISESFHGSTTALVIIGGIFALLGLLALKNVFPAAIKAKSGKHPLLKAIKEGQKDYLVWVYKKQIDTTLGSGGATIASSYNIAYFTKDCKGKGGELVLSRKDSSDDLIDYLCTQFDIPYLGYADDTREAVNIYFETKGWKKL